MPHRLPLYLVVTCIALFSACDRSETPQKKPEATGAAAADKQPDTKTNADPLVLDHTRGVKPCAAMPASVASSAINVPEGQLETNSFGKICLQTRKGGDEATEAYAQLGALNVFETVDKAKARFEASTRDTSAAKMKEINAEIRKKGGEELDQEANAEAKKDAAGQVMDALAGVATYEPVDGVGDEAAMNEQDGQLHVRAGNVYFYVLAWSGPAIGDRSAATTEEIKAKRLAHLKKNWDKQKTIQVDLANDVIENLSRLQ